MSSKINEIAKMYSIRIKDGNFCLDDIAQRIIESKSVMTYMKKIHDKIQVDKLYFVNENIFKELIMAGKSTKCKTIRDLLDGKKKPDEIILSNTDDKITTNDYLFDFKGNKVKAIGNKDEFWFKAKDIADILGYSNTRQAIIENVSEKDKEKYKVLCEKLTVYPTDGYKSNEGSIIYINESGLYSLIMGSKKKEAQEFKNWVTSEVLPSIRKTGKYDIAQTASKKNQPKFVYELAKYVNKSCIYILCVDSEKQLYKYGNTDRIMKRMNNHDQKLKFESFVKIFEVPNKSVAMSIENDIKKLVVTYGINTRHDNGIEFFITDEHFTIDFVLKCVEKFIKERTSEEEGNKIMNNTKNHIEDKISQQYEKSVLQEKTKHLLLEAYITKMKLSNQVINETDFFNSIEKSMSPIVNFSENVAENLFTDNNTKYLEDDNMSEPDYDDNNLLVAEEKPKKVAKKSNQIKKEDCKPENKKENMPSHKTNCPMKCGNLMDKISKKCNRCTQKEKVQNNRDFGNKPSYKQLKEDLKTMPYTKVGNKYGVSDNAIRKWLKAYEKHGLTTL